MGSWPSEGWAPYPFPTTLTDFASWWDKLNSPRVLVYVDRVKSRGKAGYLFGTLPVVPVAVFEKSTDLPSDTASSDTPLSAPRLYQRQSPVVVWDDANSKSPFAFEMDVSEWTEISLLQSSFIGRFCKNTTDPPNDRLCNWKTGAFSMSFSDLSRATEGLGSSDLEETRKRLLDSTAKASEVFEAFGMKFPIGQITGWGITAVLVVQFYMLIYLRQLAGKLRLDDPGWDVPGIGMNTSPTAQFAFFFTLIVGPAVAIGLLCGRAGIDILVDSTNGTWRLWQWTWLPGNLTAAFRVAGLVLAFIWTVMLGLMSWKYRPRLVDLSSGSGETGLSTTNDEKGSGMDRTADEQTIPNES